MADPAVKEARVSERRRLAGMAGYGSTIASSPLGVTTPAFTTGNKTVLGA
jgi:hypothetical protein